MSRKIFIVGAGGMVGSVCAYNLLLKELVENIVLIDIDPIKLNGQYLDLFHSTVVTKNTKVRIGNYSEIEDDDIVVITAGVAQKPGESRLSLCDSNECIIEDIVSKIMANGKNIFILMVTNPVDVLTYIAFKKSGLSKERVFGSGTTTDTIRLEAHLSEKLNVDQNNIEGYVLGEHGDSCFTSFSQTKVNGSPLQTLLNNYQISEIELNQYLRSAALKIIDAKGATYFGIATVVGEILDSLINNKNKIYNVCSYIENEYGLENTVLSLPHKVSAEGVKIIHDIGFTEKELGQLKNSSEIINKYTKKQVLTKQ